MVDYQKPYALLCRTIDNVIDPLMEIPDALPCAVMLRSALEQSVFLDLSRATGAYNSVKPLICGQKP